MGQELSGRPEKHTDQLVCAESFTMLNDIQHVLIAVYRLPWLVLLALRRAMRSLQRPWRPSLRLRVSHATSQSMYLKCGTQGDFYLRFTQPGRSVCDPGHATVYIQVYSHCRRCGGQRLLEGSVDGYVAIGRLRWYARNREVLSRDYAKHHFLGALNQGWIADKYSRKYAIVIAVGVFTIGTVLQVASVDYAMLTIARTIGGIGIGQYVQAELMGLLLC